jgi:hypothetical protein
MAGSVFGFASAGHFWASAMHDLKNALTFVEQGAVSIGKSEGTVEGITALLPNGSQAVVLERAAFSALGLVASAVHAAGAAVDGQGVNLSLDGAAAAAFRALIDGAKGDLEKLGYKI